MWDSTYKTLSLYILLSISLQRWREKKTSQTRQDRIAQPQVLPDFSLVHTLNEKALEEEASSSFCLHMDICVRNSHSPCHGCLFLCEHDLACSPLRISGSVSHRLEAQLQPRDLVSLFKLVLRERRGVNPAVTRVRKICHPFRER